RNYTKWDDQPASVAAAQEAILRAHQIADTAPKGPTYVIFDAAMQEAKLDSAPPTPDVKRFRAPLPAEPAAALVEDAAKRLHVAQRPIILIGRVTRSEQGWA